MAKVTTLTTYIVTLPRAGHIVGSDTDHLVKTSHKLALLLHAHEESCVPQTVISPRGHVIHGEDGSNRDQTEGKTWFYSFILLTR